MQERDDKSEFIIAFSGGHHFILEYLTDEVIGSLSEEQRHFLLKTSILNQLCEPLCDDVLDTQNSRDMLLRFQRDNIFITSLDDERYWFRYNHLFVDLLGNLLRREYLPANIGELHLRASKWYDQHGYPTEAIEHAMQAQSFETAASLIEKAASGKMLHGHITTLLSWLEELPESVLNSRPRLRFYKGWAISLSGQPKIAEKILLDVKTDLEKQPNSPENLTLRGELAALLTGIITYSNDPRRIIQEAQEAIAYLPEENLISRARVHIALGTAYAYDDKIEKATHHLQQARDLALKAENPFLATSAIEMLAGMQIYHLGRLHEAENNLQRVLGFGKNEFGTAQAFTGTAHILLAEIYLEWNKLDTAARHLNNGIELLKKGGIGYSWTHTYCAKARLEYALNNQWGVIEALELSKQATQRCPLLHTLVHNIAYQSKIFVCLGDIETAEQWVTAEAINIGNQELPQYLFEVQEIALARVYLAQGKLDETLEKLEPIFEKAKSAGRMAHVIDICLLKAMTLHRQGEVNAAIDTLKYALSLAAPEDAKRKFLEAGDSVLELLQATTIQKSYSQFVCSLLQADTRKSSPKTTPPLQLPTKGDLAEPLTHRENEVLELIAAGYTNQQIADEIVVTLNTVKKHTTHIYAKLGVQNRTEASNLARELGLV
jgi:LuxR family maltose regulon positive regulatory protein